MLDLGAGDGGVTAVLQNYYKQVYVTETSTIMQWRLQSRNMTVLPIDEWMNTNINFDLICALNLIDRHYQPRKLLADLRETSLRYDSFYDL